MRNSMTGTDRVDVGWVTRYPRGRCQPSNACPVGNELPTLRELCLIPEAPLNHSTITIPGLPTPRIIQ